MDNRLVAFERLLNIMDELREKCPWDKKQTFDSLRHLTIEEVYELADAIMQKDLKAIEGEIGDVFMHMVFYSLLGREEDAFDVTSVLNKVCDKLVERHPHIYGDVAVQDEEDVKVNWEKIKLKEGRSSVLEGVPAGLPALVKAQRIQEKVRGVGFDWELAADVWNKVEEEIAELEVEVRNNTIHKEEEFGDLMFALVNYARFIDVNPETALEKANLKFKDRFQKMEVLIKEDGKVLSEMTLPQMDIYWDKVKSFNQPS